MAVDELAQELARSSSPAFVPVVAAPSKSVAKLAGQALRPTAAIAVALHVRLSNGVEFDLGQAGLEELTTVVQILERLPCSGSTKA